MAVLVGFMCFKQESESDLEEVLKEEEASAARLERLRTTSTKLFRLTQAVRQLRSSLSTAMRGEAFDKHTA